MISTDTGLGLLLSALVVLSMVPMASAGAAAEHSQTTDTTDDGYEPADEIYVRDNGSAVLVYEEDNEDSYETDDEPANVEYGADISSNLFYFLVSEPIEEDTDVTGQASLVFQESNISGDGQLSFDQPETLSSLSFRTAGEVTNENAQADMNLDATFESPPATGTSQFESASTVGNVTVTGSDFYANGEFDAQFEQQAGTEPIDGSFVLTEDDGDYTLEVERNRTLSYYEVDQYSTREQARETLEQQFGGTAESFGGTAEVTIERYEFTQSSGGTERLSGQSSGETERLSAQSSGNADHRGSQSTESARLDIAYTVEYTGVEEGVTETVAEEISRDEEIDIDSERADELATQMQNLQIERIETNYEVTSESASADFDIDVRNYDDVALAAIEIAQSADEDALDTEGLENIEDLRAQIEAQRAADLRQQMTWNVDVDKPSPGEVSVDAEADYTTENWDDYVDELDSRGIPTYDTSYTLTANTTADDRVDVTGSLTVDGDVFSEFSDQMMAASAEDPEDRRLLVALMQADPQQGQVNISADGEQVRVEVGAQFRNLTVLRDALAENETIPPGVTSVVGRTNDDGTTTTYVTVENAVGSDASESDVRALRYVDDETEIYMPGDWDREFPSVDTQRAASFLGVQNPANTTANATATSGGSGPGFGVTAALVALLGAALLARRRT